MKSYMKKGLICFVIILAGIFILVKILCNRANDSPSYLSAPTQAQSESAAYESVSPVQEAVEQTQDIGEGNTPIVTQDQAEILETTTKKSRFKKTTEKEETTIAQTTRQQTTAAPVQSTYAYSYAGYNPKMADLSGDWRLWLVNRDYILPDGYTPTLAYSVTGDSSSKQLDYRVAPYYNEMYLAAKADGITLTTLSGYRSYNKQKTNFENKINTYLNQGYDKIKATQEAATIILPPGTSEHNAGLAMDICSLYESFENSNEYKWLDEHAQDYGFILRYPKDKQNITKIIYEPWHWRYVGAENAKAIKASGKCLEEWLGK